DGDHATRALARTVETREGEEREEEQDAAHDGLDAAEDRLGAIAEGRRVRGVEIPRRRAEVIERRGELRLRAPEPRQRRSPDVAARSALEARVLARLVPDRAALVGHVDRSPRAARGLRADQQIPAAVDADERAPLHSYAVANRPRSAAHERDGGDGGGGARADRERYRSADGEEAEDRREREALRSHERGRPHGQPGRAPHAKRV